MFKLFVSELLGVFYSAVGTWYVHIKEAGSSVVCTCTLALVYMVLLIDSIIFTGPNTPLRLKGIIVIYHNTAS